MQYIVSIPDLSPGIFMGEGFYKLTIRHAVIQLSTSLRTFSHLFHKFSWRTL